MKKTQKNKRSWADGLPDKNDLRAIIYLAQRLINLLSSQLEEQEESEAKPEDILIVQNYICKWLEKNPDEQIDELMRKHLGQKYQGME